MGRWTAAAVWVALGVALILPLALAASSPLLEWRGPIYIVASFAGIAAFCLLLVQPLLAGGLIPKLRMRPGRHIHKLLGVVLVGLIVAHVGGLWITSPPDVIDALTFTSPTPFSGWGVVAMWAAFAAAALAALRHRLQPRVWRLGHMAAVATVAITTIVHALLIQGTMAAWTKWLLGVLVLLALARVLTTLRIGRLLRRPRSRA